MSADNKAEQNPQHLADHFPDDATSVENHPQYQQVAVLLRRMQITAECRFHAAARLQRKSHVSFFTTTILSLGLILIPLLQNARVPLCFPEPVLAMMQIFLAVAVLVYSIVMAKENLEVRSLKFHECAERLQDIARIMEHEIVHHRDIERISKEYNDQYSDLMAGMENHTRLDWRFVKAQRSDLYPIPGWHRTFLLVTAYLGSFGGLLLPLVMLVFECVFVTDMLGLTHWLPAVFYAPLTNHAPCVP